MTTDLGPEVQVETSIAPRPHDDRRVLAFKGIPYAALSTGLSTSLATSAVVYDASSHTLGSSLKRHRPDPTRVSGLICQARGTPS